MPRPAAPVPQALAGLDLPERYCPNILSKVVQYLAHGFNGRNG